MPYTLNFSDPTKQTTITVPDMPPGINTVDTSLNLVGRAYPNYGQKFAENFLMWILEFLILLFVAVRQFANFAVKNFPQLI